MALQFTSSSVASDSQGVKIAVFGRAGMGKTVLNATLPNPIMLSAESGSLSLRKANIERMFGVGNPSICYDVPMIQITQLSDLEEAYQWLTESAEANNFQSVSMDSVSEIAELVLKVALQKSKDPRQAYGEVQDKVSTLLRAYRDLQGKHVYFSAKQGETKDDANGAIKYGVSMPGAKLGIAVPYFFDEVFAYRIGRDETGKEFRYLQTNPDFQYESKDRSGALNAMEYPHLGAIIQKIMQN